MAGDSHDTNAASNFSRKRTLLPIKQQETCIHKLKDSKYIPKCRTHHKCIQRKLCHKYVSLLAIGATINWRSSNSAE